MFFPFGRRQFSGEPAVHFYRVCITLFFRPPVELSRKKGTCFFSPVKSWRLGVCNWWWFDWNASQTVATLGPSPRHWFRFLSNTRCLVNWPVCGHNTRLILSVDVDPLWLSYLKLRVKERSINQLLVTWTFWKTIVRKKMATANPLGHWATGRSRPGTLVWGANRPWKEELSVCLFRIMPLTVLLPKICPPQAHKRGGSQGGLGGPAKQVRKVQIRMFCMIASHPLELQQRMFPKQDHPTVPLSVLPCRLSPLVGISLALSAYLSERLLRSSNWHIMKPLMSTSLNHTLALLLLMRMRSCLHLIIKLSNVDFSENQETQANWG